MINQTFVGTFKFPLVIFVLLIGSFFLWVQPIHAAGVLVSWEKTNQVISGFGASCAWTHSLTEGQADMFFSTTNGAGLSLLRARVPTDGTIECGSIMKQAAARGARVWATPWTPPAPMKTNGSLTGGGSLLAGSFQAYADYLTNYVTQVKSQYGISLYALSVQNEPDYTTSYDSAIWSGQNIHDFVLNNLGPNFVSRGLATKIMLPEHSGWDFSLAEATLLDPSAAAYVGIIGTHNYNYGNASPYSLAQHAGKELWETEVSTFEAFDGSIGNALLWAKRMNDWLTIANVNSWNYWWLYTLNGNDNEGLADSLIHPAKRLYVMGNYSRFVRPGFVRIDATMNPSIGISVSAYKNSATGAFVLVAINQTSSAYPLTVQADTGLGSLTPYTTSATQNLIAGSAIASTYGFFSASVPAQSVVTYVSNATTLPSANSAAPAALTAPTNLSSSGISSTQANLTWAPSSDASGVAGYVVYRNGVKVGMPVGTSYLDVGLTPMTTYSYAIEGFDLSGNISPKSDSLFVTTLDTPLQPFAVGMKVKTTAPTNVRKKSSITAKLNCTMPIGSVGKIVNGPQNNGGYTWWNVQFDSGCSGWTIQNNISTTLVLIPPIPIARHFDASSTLARLSAQLKDLLNQMVLLRASSQAASLEALH